MPSEIAVLIKGNEAMENKQGIGPGRVYRSDETRHITGTYKPRHSAYTAGENWPGRPDNKNKLPVWVLVLISVMAVAIVILSVQIASGLSGEEEGWETVYAPVLKVYKEASLTNFEVCLVEGRGSRQAETLNENIVAMIQYSAMYSGQDERARARAIYAFSDLDDDGINELLIGTRQICGDECKDTIWDVWTMSGGKPARMDAFEMCDGLVDPDVDWVEFDMPGVEELGYV